MCKIHGNVLNGSYTSLHGTNELPPTLSIFTLVGQIQYRLAPHHANE